MNPLSGVGAPEYDCGTMKQPVQDPRWFRTSRGLTMRELAASADVVERTVYELEAGRPVSLLTIRKIAVALGVDPLVLERAWLNLRESKVRRASK